jgi:hypothetical protein
MKHLRIAILVGLLAIIIGGVAHVSRRTKRNPTPDELLLQRHLASVHIHNLSVNQALAQLQKLIGVPISANYEVQRFRGDPAPRIWLDFNDIAICDLLHAFLGQLNGDDVMDFAVNGNAIVLANSSGLPQFLRVYDVADLRPDAPLPLRAGASIPDEIIGGMQFVASNREYGPADPPAPWIWRSSTQICALQTEAGHQRMERMLNAVRKSRPDGLGPEIPNDRALGFESLSTAIRFYDVRDLIDRMDYTPFSQWNGAGVEMEFTRSEGIFTLARVVASRGAAETWMTVNAISSIAGRLVIDQTPQVHALIRHALADLRAGKTVDGYHLRRPVGTKTKANAISPQMNRDEPSAAAPQIRNPNDEIRIKSE